jgi:glycosyltransferase involved in cell wall biosynthesis
MAITFAIHEATRTGAPRLGALIARELQRQEPVHVIAMKDGPLKPWLHETLGRENVTICQGEPFHVHRPFEERVRLAAELLAQAPSDVVYVNSLAASVFALAAAQDKRKTLLHVHEKASEFANLLLLNVAKIDVMRAADAVVLASQDMRADLLEAFRYTPAEIETIGVGVDVEAVRAAAKAPAPAPRNAGGAPLVRGERLVVGMSGHASPRKGADVFFDLAAGAPECDFLWVGGWRPEEAPENAAYAAFERARLPHFYVCGAVDNPYPYMAMMDLFFLSSREDPNPLVLGEALALGVPALAFSRTTGVADRLGRWAIVCYGEPNVKDAARVLRACDARTLRSPAFREAGAAYLADYDLRAKMPRIVDLIARLRGESAPTAKGVRQRALDGGGLEISFT